VTTGNYRSHQFTNVGSNTFTVHKAGRCDILIVAGGGGGSSSGGFSTPGGGGGGGQVIHLQNYKLDVLTFNIVVGKGGSPSANGDSSAFHTITAIGGGSNNIAGGSGAGGRRGASGALAIAPPVNLIPRIILAYVSPLVGWSGVRKLATAMVMGNAGTPGSTSFLLHIVVGSMVTVPGTASFPLEATPP
jgi:hypothetical protein